MALFGTKKSPVEKLWEDFGKLSEEDKAGFRAKLEDIDKAEDEREVDKIEEDKSESPEVEDEKKEEVGEESEEIGKDVNEAEDEAKVDVEEEPAEEPKEEVEEPIGEEPVEEPAEPMEEMAQEVAEKEQGHDLLAGLEARLKALEDKFMSLSEKEEPKDIGVSGFGKATKEDIYEDNRAEDIVKRLGGRAY